MNGNEKKMGRLEIDHVNDANKIGFVLFFPVPFSVFLAAVARKLIYK